MHTKTKPVASNHPKLLLSLMGRESACMGPLNKLVKSLRAPPHPTPPRPRVTLLAPADTATS